ncbi:MAG: alkaline phosphatase family protein [Gammaproteobacteria bacterium]|nr:alkaline phosphatase family protein [Gammaproteobacteria bacterium]MYF02196.1 alkaline phosphatase family protein [Gammaproteobacteria bacterium]MYI77452.1 alkaline phosphatase family protein [Gammaproteobacteria bacterium]
MVFFVPKFSAHVSNRHSLRLFLVLTLGVINLGITHAALSNTVKSLPSTNTTQIAFGSCIDERKQNHPIWKALNSKKPDVMVFMGDNLYFKHSDLNQDTTLDTLKIYYDRLAKTPGLRRLRESSTEILAIWDDHDYGTNDSDSTFPLKKLAQSQFLNFWYGTPIDVKLSPGIYRSVFYAVGDKTMQVILLDTRFFRTPWKRDLRVDEQSYGAIVPTTESDGTMLGDDQWMWLEDRLQQQADLHILVSSIQVLPVDHDSERWDGMPKERDRLLQLVSNASAYTIILSGDRHLAEASKLPRSEYTDLKYDLYEFTSSPMTSGAGHGRKEINRYRVMKKNVRVNNFGLLTIDWSADAIKAEFINRRGKSVQQISISKEMNIKN